MNLERLNPSARHFNAVEGSVEVISTVTRGVREEKLRSRAVGAERWWRFHGNLAAPTPFLISLPLAPSSLQTLIFNP
ncbi:hypothetical protein Bca4012_027348 [Brassica carinata]